MIFVHQYIDMTVKLLVNYVTEMTSSTIIRLWLKKKTRDNKKRENNTLITNMNNLKSEIKEAKKQ